MNRLASRGLLGTGLPAGTPVGPTPRLKLADLVHQAARQYGRLEPQDRLLVRRLQREFADELQALGVPPRFLAVGHARPSAAL
jgi:hypothetical protein